MEMFQLVAGIDAVKKAMRDQYHDDGLLPPVEPGFTPFRYEISSEPDGVVGWRQGERGAPAQDQERDVA
jgi:hypothetical protein